MITKLGHEIIKEAGLLAGGLGMYRASDLTDDERAALTKHYGLASDANLAGRNAARGMVGNFIGGIPGAAMIGYGALTKNPKTLALGSLASLGGGLVGSYLATNKYSKGKAKKIMNSGGRG